MWEFSLFFPARGFMVYNFHGCAKRNPTCKPRNISMHSPVTYKEKLQTLHFFAARLLEITWYFFFSLKFRCKGSCFTAPLSLLATPFSVLLYQRPDIELACGPVSVLLWLNYGKPFEQIGCESNGSECAISCQVAAVMQPFTGALLEHFHWGQEGPEQQGCKNKFVPKWKVCLERVQLWTSF